MKIFAVVAVSVAFAAAGLVDAVKLKEKEQVVLKDSAQVEAHQDPNLPAGNYQDSCTECSITDSAILTCSCYNSLGQLQPATSLANAWTCEGCLANNDGSLFCQLPFSSAQNGYQDACRGCGVSYTNLFCTMCSGMTSNPPYVLDNGCSCTSVSFNPDQNRLICNVDTPNPTFQPTNPTRQPTNPTWQPTNPTFQPTNPTFQPTFPTLNPTNPTRQPTFPTWQPTNPTPNPSFPTFQPTFPTPNPSNPTFQPTFPTFQPTNPTRQPTFPTFQPTNPTPNPSFPTFQPTNPTLQPTNPTFGPTEMPTQQPVTNSPTPNAAPPQCEAYWLNINQNGVEKAPFKSCTGGDFTNSHGCQYQNWCCWQYTSAENPTEGVCRVPNGVPVDCPNLGQNACQNNAGWCTWDSSYGVAGLCRRICPGDPTVMCVY